MKGVVHTSDGLTLPTVLDGPEGGELGVVIAHPHPLFGGNMDSHVVARLFEAAVEGGNRAIRFGFRGSRGADGQHSGGAAERLDVLAAIEALETNKVVLAGYSFGADVILSVDHPCVIGWFAVAAPLSNTQPIAAKDTRHVVLMVPEFDQIRQPGAAENATAHWVNTSVSTVPGADHSLMTGMDIVVDAFADFCPA